MYRLHYLLLAVLTMTIVSCGSGDDPEQELSPEEQEFLEQQKQKEATNKWIYYQMHRNYLWADQMPDSASCDYTLDGDKFFKTLVIANDRFSYCSTNYSYSPSTRITIPEGTTSVYLDSIYRVGNKKVGYLCYLEFNAESDLHAPFKRFYEQKIDDLILDLRYNRGGNVSTSRYLCSSIVDENAYGKLFQKHVFNERLSGVNYRETGDSAIRYNFYTVADTVGRKILYLLNLKRVFVLTSNQTASASEATIVCLHPFMNVITIGEQTVGKGVGSRMFSDTQYRYELHPVTFRYYNIEGNSVPDNGIVPDYPISGGTDIDQNLLGNTNEPYLKKAIELILQQ